jgi:hypothetical protein
MSICLRALASVLVVTTASAVSASQPETKRTPPVVREGIVTDPQYTLRLPPGWRLVRSDGKRQGESGPMVSDWVFDRFEDDRGNFFEVNGYFWTFGYCMGPDGRPMDLLWFMHWDGASQQLVIDKEFPQCKRERCDEPPGYQCGLCEVGDGKLHVLATTGEEEPILCFDFGNTRRETGVDLAPFRAMIASIRVAPSPNK